MIENVFFRLTTKYLRKLNETLQENYRTTIHKQSHFRLKENNPISPSSGIVKRSTSQTNSILSSCLSPVEPRPSQQTLNKFYNETGNECKNTFTLYNKYDCSYLSQG